MMSQALSWLISRVCATLADRCSWIALCSKCARVYARYGEGEPIPGTFSYSPSEVFDETNVEGNVMRFVAYILWLKQQPDSFKKYLDVREQRFELWRQCVYTLWRL